MFYLGVQQTICSAARGFGEAREEEQALAGGGCPSYDRDPEIKRSSSAEMSMATRELECKRCQ